ncbi:MAG: hypothetical protein JWM53_961 [bacterium]|nr:hypothetical protein [bacterium]
MSTDDDAHDAGELVERAPPLECTRCSDERPMVAVDHGFIDGGKLPYVQLRCSAGHMVFWGEPGAKYTGGPLWWRLKIRRQQFLFRMHHVWLLAKARMRRQP